MTLPAETQEFSQAELAGASVRHLIDTQEFSREELAELTGLVLLPTRVSRRR